MNPNQQPTNQTPQTAPVAQVPPTTFVPPTAVPNQPQLAAPATNAATPAQLKNPSSTQNTLMFQELRDNMVIMGDGTFRSVVAAQSVNFDLMSEREREGIEYSYQQFLNSLNFPIQIYIRSQKVDIGPYLDKLEQLRINQDNMLLGVLMDDYIQFIDALSQEANIMDKSFFVVIPYAVGDEHVEIGKDSDTTKGLLTNLFMPTKRHQHIRVSSDNYEHAKEEMSDRVNAVIDGLSQIGVHAARLQTRELGALYYNVYNPDTAMREPLGDFRNFTAPVVRKSEGTPPTNATGGTNG